MPAQTWTGNYGSDQTLLATDTHNQTADVTTNGGTFTINAGVTYNVDNAGGVFTINNGGHVVANGTATNHIIMDATGGATTPKKRGSWGRLTHNSNTAGTSLTYVSLRNATNGLDIAAAAAYTFNYCEAINCAATGIRLRAAAGAGAQTHTGLRTVKCGFEFSLSAVGYTLNDCEIVDSTSGIGSPAAGLTNTWNRLRMIGQQTQAHSTTGTTNIDASFVKNDTQASVCLTKSAGTVSITNTVLLGVDSGLSSVAVRGAAAEAAFAVSGCDLLGWDGSAAQRISTFSDCHVAGNVLADPANIDLTEATISTNDPIQYGGGGLALTVARATARATRKMPLTFQAPALGASTSSTQVITAMSDSKCNAWIEYGTVSGVYTMRTAGDAEYQDPITGMRQVGWCGIRGDTQALVAHSRTLVGLNANTLYYYRARGESPLFEDFTASAQQTFTTPTTAALAVDTAALDQAQLTKTYHEEVHASGGATPYTWDISVDALPAGLSIAAGTGIITGTPTTVGTTTFTVRVTDSQGTPATATLATSITVNPAGGGGAFGSALRTGGGL